MAVFSLVAQLTLLQLSLALASRGPYSSSYINAAGRASPIDHELSSFHHRLVSAENASSFALNVLDFGAKGDARTDNADAFNKALQSAKNNLRGGYVYVPSGQYLFTSSITIPTGVSLIGTYLVTPQHKASTNNKQGITWDNLEDGSVLGFDGSTSEEFILMKGQISFPNKYDIPYTGKSPC